MARQAIMAVAMTAQPGEVRSVPVPARSPVTGSGRAVAPSPVVPAAQAPLAGSAIVPALPRASPQRVDPGALLLSAARTKYDTKMFDQALADLLTIVRDHTSSAAAPEAYLLIARIDSQQGRLDEAIAALSHLRGGFAANPANAEGCVMLAQLLGRSKRPDRVALARQVLAEVPQRFPDSPWAPRALAQRAQLETRERVKDTHPSLGTVPAALLTNRVLTEKYPTAPEAEFAYWQLGGDYEDRKAYALAAAAFTELGTRFPQTKFDAWWRAGELYTKRLKNQAAAKAAYARVPPTSPKYKDAQKRLKEK
jgi:TolA-binding protein